MERTDMDYLDFDLIVESAGDGYRARVINSPAGQASVEFAVPFSELELDNFRLRIGLPRRGMRRVDSKQMDSVKALGGRLFHSVFNDEVLDCLRSSLEEAERQKRTGVRLRLRLGDDPKLAELPWEYLYNPRQNHFLSLSVKTPLVRYLEQPGLLKPLAVKPPLRVLVMISSPLEDEEYEPLNVEREWELLRSGVGDLEQRGLIALERLEQATLPALQRQLQRGEYHVFHFIGHGGFDARADQGVLVLEDEERSARVVSAQQLGALLHDEDSLRLVVLNACEGARAGADPFAGTAQGLIQRGIPAVIAMQFEFSDSAALTLTQAFYTALASGYPVDAALAEARKAIFVAGNEVEWGTPVLYMRAPDGRIFDIRNLSEAERLRAQIDALEREAQAATGAEQWEVAVEKLQEALALDPADERLGERLQQVTRQRQLVELYQAATRHYEAGRLQEALDHFLRVRESGGNYKGVDAQIAALRREMTREAAENERRAQETATRERERQEEEQARQAHQARERQRQEEQARRAEQTTPPPPEPRPVPPVEKERARPGLKPYLVGGAVGVMGLFLLLVFAAMESERGGEYVPEPIVPFYSDVQPQAGAALQPAPPAAMGLAPEAARVIAPPPPPPDPTEQHRAEILAFVRRASEAESEAFKRRDPSLLQGFYTGVALQNLHTAIQSFESEGVHQASQLLEQRIASVRVVPDGRSAQVEMTETWSTEYHSNQGDICVLRFPVHTIPQTLHLVRGGGGWRISEAVFAPNYVTPQPHLC